MRGCVAVQMQINFHVREVIINFPISVVPLLGQADDSKSRGKHTRSKRQIFSAFSACMIRFLRAGTGRTTKHDAIRKAIFRKISRAHQMLHCKEGNVMGKARQGKARSLNDEAKQSELYENDANTFMCVYVYRHLTLVN